MGRKLTLIIFHQLSQLAQMLPHFGAGKSSEWLIAIQTVTGRRCEQIRPDILQISRILSSNLERQQHRALPTRK